MIKNILLSLAFVMPLLGKNAMDVEFVSRFNRLEERKKEISKKEAFIDKLNKEISYLFSCISYGLSKDEEKAIYDGTNEFEQKLAKALEKNEGVASLLQETLCPDIEIHRNEINRLQNMVIRLCMDYFLLKVLWQEYTKIAIEAYNMHYEATK